MPDDIFDLVILLAAPSARGQVLKDFVKIDAVSREAILNKDAMWIAYGALIWAECEAD